MVNHSKSFTAAGGPVAQGAPTTAQIGTQGSFPGKLLENILNKCSIEVASVFFKMVGQLCTEKHAISQQG
ncbi:hypothetical protein A0H81_03705 [Grifola frondosa]|uniref:Uncharacterized protein n=1 Tax=Grifola frondosa TaxID=5627 RepID=A0A1C7MI93_GRIFR|nr:hypothetical protein A0H81_03705 [Grifola frondosa]